MIRFFALLLILFSAALLFGDEHPAKFPEEHISNLLENWFAAENSLYLQRSFQYDSHDHDNLLFYLEKFQMSLESFTQSLVFLQYENMGLLPENSGEEFRRKIKNMINYVNEGNIAAAAMEAQPIREELALYVRLDTKVSSLIFSRFAFIFGVFAALIIILIAAIWYLYRALRISQIQEKDSEEFSEIIIMAQENERTLISADLHDTVLQDMGQLLRMSESDNSLSALIRRIINRTREICIALMPPDFSRLALTDSLIQLCSDFEKRSSAECRALIAEDFFADRLLVPMQLQIYRIVQESLNNIEKHAQAKEVTLTARNKDDKTILVCITDDGIGISGEEPSRGMGIRGMYRRAQILGASLSFIPGAGVGVTVRLEVPIMEVSLQKPFQTGYKASLSKMQPRIR